MPNADEEAIQEAAWETELAESVDKTVETDEAAAPHKEKSPDPILAVYREPLSKNRVVYFFEELTGSREIAAVILEQADLFDVSPAMAFSLCWEESRYNPKAINRSNRNKTIDRGLFQLNSASFPSLSEKDFFDPGINTHNGIAHLGWCLEAAETEVSALAMYNAGHNRVKQDGTPESTLDYVSRILKRQSQIESRFLAATAAINDVENEKTKLEKKPPVFPLRFSLLALPAVK